MPCRREISKRVMLASGTRFLFKDAKSQIQAFCLLCNDNDHRGFYANSDPGVVHK